MKKLVDIAEIRVSNVDKKTNPNEKPVKLCNYMDVYSNLYVANTHDFMVGSATRTEIERFTLHAGDVVITKDSETPDDIGIASVIIDEIENLVCGYHLALIRPDSDELDSVYLAKQLSTPRAAKYFAIHATGSTRYGLPIRSIEMFDVPTPLKLEQTKIAEVLSTIDRAIEQTEALIAKYRRIRTGLMYGLLTCGIDEDGEIRSKKGRAFKNSPLGFLPQNWHVKRIDELLADVDPPMRSGPFGSALRKDELVESGIPLLGIDNVFPERFVKNYSRFVEPKKAETLKRYRVRPGDIMVTIMGTVGRCCVVPDDIGLALSSKHTWTISLDTKLYSPYLACLQINYAPWVLRHFAQDEQGGIMAAIKSDTLRSTLLPVPPPSEMKMIEQRMKAISDVLESKAGTVRKLRSLRRGLMQNLLTGYKRVTPLLEAGCRSAVQGS